MYQTSIKNVSFAYAPGDRLILKDINMEVAEGEFVSILGQSGCGKSTLLRLLAGLETLTSGEIQIGGKPVSGASLDRGIVFQDYGLFPWMTAGENILLALRQRFPKRDKKELRGIALRMLDAVGLEPSVYQKLPKELSGGMKQRCAIARAFGIDPPVLLMDEPFGALDAVTRAKLQDLVLELWSRQEPKKTVFFVTHDVDEALLLSSRIFVLGQSPGSVIFQCSLPADRRPTRDTQFEDPELLQLRNTLIRSINQDVAARIAGRSEQ
ncbi:MAG: ABC transporter ATP-binding protein [Oscillibacter sp.]|jgi:NitT/TauT family transport system ATP-binding protein|nr:ABC transporter ATP-binding protein [Oscillibacter sp.]